MADNRYNDSFIRELQNKLRIIGISTGEPELVVPENGILDTNTLNALSVFKNKYGLPSDNIIDMATLEKLNEVLNNEKLKRDPPASISPYPRDADYELSQGEVSELVYILQLMLNSISMYYDIPRIPVNGIFGSETENAVRTFQRINQIPIDGIVGRLTWSRLAEEYNETVNDSE